MGAIDTALFNWINVGLASPALDRLMTGLTFVGEKSWLVLLAAPLGWLSPDNNVKRFCVLLLPLVFLSDSVPSLVKLIVARPRPFAVLSDARLIVPIDRLSDFGFPSNHASNVFAVATLFGAAIGSHLALVPFIAATLVCFSRVYVGVHFPGDVVGGGIIGAALALAVYELDERARRVGDTGTRAWTLAALVAAGLLVQFAWRSLR